MPADIKQDYQKRIITIPNILSLFRLLLIPVFVWLYTVKADYVLTAVMLVVSAITDIVDGFIARKFNMISNFGKAFDPIADKLTQAAMLFCLVVRFPYMIVPLVLLVIKEVVSGIVGLITIRKTKEVFGAEWHGKATTVSLYLMMLIHLVWFNIPSYISDILIGFCIGIMLMSFVLYFIRNSRLIKEATKKA